MKDRTTGGNIRWCTHDYEHLGEGYGYQDEIMPERITGEHGHTIMPRVLKSKRQQTERVKNMAEVFTPMRVVKMMVENVEVGIDTRCMELTCGEAPFLVSRYDSTTGEPIPIQDRVGILDGKLRLANSRKRSDKRWLELVRQAFQSTYGYEWQGDSLLLARENLLYTFVDHYEARFGCNPNLQMLLEYAEIVSWNLWQMDGLSYRIPQENKEEPQLQTSLFDEVHVEAPAPFCIIMDWQKGEIIKVQDIKNKHQYTMKFDVIIGNPPYQEEVEGDNKQFATPVYNLFIDESQKVGNIVEMIHPARFLFNAGATPKKWNKKMLKDEHFKILEYISNSANAFPNTNINGGIAISYWDEKKQFNPIESFTPFDCLSSIKDKVTSNNFIGDSPLLHVLKDCDS